MLTVTVSLAEEPPTLLGPPLPEAPSTPATPAIPAPMMEPPSGTTPEIIREIRFVGNETTKPQIFLQEMKVQVGDPVDPEKIEQSRQAIMDLGLYKSVYARVLSDDDGGGSVLEITVDEKYYILPIPKADYNEDTNKIAYGAQLRMDNLAGINQQLKITYEPQSANDPDLESTTTSVEYVYPRIRGSVYELDFAAERRYTPFEGLVDNLPSQYETQLSLANLNLSRWFVRESPTVGWRAGVGLAWQKQVVDTYLGERPAAREATGVAVALRVERVKVRDLLYSRNGHEYGYTGEFGAPFLGSDSDYVRHVIFYRSFMPVLNRPHRNLNVQLQLGMASEPVLGGKAFSLGGSKTLRGYDSGSIIGNAFVLANVEFLTPLFDRNEVRGVVFTDIGNAYPTNSELDFSGLKTSVGLGIRWKLKSFVKIDLRIDCGYNIDTGDSKCNGGTRESF